MVDTLDIQSVPVSRRDSFNTRDLQTRNLKPFNSGDIKILLLENVSQKAVDILKKAGYQVEFHTKALDKATLIEKIKDVHAVGIRSKTKLTEEVLAHANKLLTIGCFCIGTNQVDLTYAASRGICVFNSPFSNSRSVAELVIAEIILLARQLGDRSREMHTGVWNKVSKRCYEIRGKTLGIVGYGHIGTQLGVLAESLGMHVVWYDILPVMPIGTSRAADSLDEVLSEADFVSLHVPETPETKNMIGARELAHMKQGAYLINASRGTVVDIDALAEALQSGHLAGAAVDVYPTEPLANGPGFESPLRNCPNTLLTPHIGGSTEEAQRMIGIEVATAIVKYINSGASINAVNFAECDLRAIPSTDLTTVRIVNVHQNVPGVLRQINNILADYNVNKQISDSKGDVAYFMADVTVADHKEINTIYEQVTAMNENIITRVLF
ncbi:D-3-phosphoglycerate dehydrogenase 2 [Coemansia spiralis]|uniref:D-3-phosphoglycerate dehydrogenase 2 n=2 Tax=Coemansia TaxID=4863 RepID=A0A9W8KYR8_9FUNG|nr:D-isomer specific 2-hydroxyacid dehydrogenase [Coemansia spiralis]KAJ1996237.1 D-3-phosphoglycerate dehydrogenase 2 [Coemansia umbellata]KAJ2626007.1 D-3-phosphoglycerate dehydrogenase 2 [Coemansia sp. RSA 1358]KAJ2678639.1 D-3-phosphoglycerate dehydrogenase 2 [Coemansia spiralis]